MCSALSVRRNGISSIQHTYCLKVNRKHMMLHSLAHLLINCIAYTHFILLGCYFLSHCVASSHKQGLFCGKSTICCLMCSKKKKSDKKVFDRFQCVCARSCCFFLYCLLLLFAPAHNVYLINWHDIRWEMVR